MLISFGFSKIGNAVKQCLSRFKMTENKTHRNFIKWRELI